MADNATTEALADAEEHKRNYLNACTTIAAMHEAAVGEVTGPIRGVVEDVADVREAMLRAEQERDGAYRERAQLVAWLAAMHEAVIAPAPDVDEPGWQIVYLYAGGWQMSWHIHPDDAHLFLRVEQVPAEHPRAQWDGHSTEQKYNRIRNHTRVLHINERLGAAKEK